MALSGEMPPLYQEPNLHSGLRRWLRTRAVSFHLKALRRHRSQVQEAAKTLSRTGLIVIRGAAPRQAVDALATMAERTWDDVAALTPGRELPHLILNRGEHRVLRGYKALVESTKPVVNFRHGEDDGMMDVFHPENLFPENRQLILDCLHEDLVANLARRAFDKKQKVKCRNLYVNKGVENTRFYHCDGEKIKVKSFVYANNVNGFDVGPYCYIMGSHHDDTLRQRNQAFNEHHDLHKHEYRLLAGYAALPIFCRAGDMVVSAQHGAHRGYPQAASATRIVLVNLYQ